MLKNLYKIKFLVRGKIGLFLSCLLLLAAIQASPAYARARKDVTNATVKISGTVTDEKNLPLPGAAVRVKGTTVGTTTDVDGKYTLTADDHATLVITSVGYDPREVVLNGRIKVDVQLTTASKGLNEVVVVGYGTQKKRDVTGAVGSVALNNVEKTPVFGTAQLLQGQVSGVQVTQTNSQPGASFTVRIRGTNSINYSSDPLFVVDGFAGADISALNPNDIASMDVLKDASSTAIYGNRGANGVVIITTKSGTAGKNTVSADVYHGIQKVGRMLPMMNATQFATYLNQVTAYNNANNTTQTPLPYTQTQIDGLGEGTNWQKELFRTAPITNANVALSGGTPDTKYLVSMGFFNQDGIILNSGFKRGTLRFNFNHNISRKLTFGLNSQVSYTQQNIANVNTNGGSTGGTLLDALRISPIVPVIDPTTGTYTFQNGPNGVVDIVGNPVAAAMLNTDINNNLRVFFNGFGDYEIVPGLKLKVAVGTDDRFGRERIFRPNTTYLGLTTNGFAQITTPVNYNWLNENTLTYTKKFGVHNITALAGYTYQEFKFTTDNAIAQSLTTNNLNTDNLGVGGSLSSSSSTNRNVLQSFLGRVNYSLMDRYLLTVSVRRDGASVLGASHQYGTFPSGSAAWRVSSEPFMQNVKVISDLKIRGGYGVTGNSNIDPYSSLSQYGFNSYVLNNVRVVGTSPNNIGNTNLQWESTASYNVGVDLGLLQNRITLNADYYHKKTSKLLFNRTIPASSGFTTVLDNLGGVQNQGIELSLNTININKRNLRWTTNFNFSRNVNKILDLGGIPYQITGNVSSSLYPGGQNSSILQVGQPIGAFYGYVFDGIWQSQAQITASGTKQAVKPGDPRYLDINGDNNITAADRTIIGYAVPKFSYGFSSNLTVDRFNLFVLIQGVYGNKILNENLIETENGTTNDNKQAYVLTDSWHGDGTSNTLPSVGSTLRRGLGPTSDVLEDGTYLRFKTITLTYDVPLPKLTPVFKSASIYVTGQNLITITKYKGYDPEVNSYSNSGGNFTSIGTDYNPYPNIRTYTIGARFGF